MSLKDYKAERLVSIIEPLIERKSTGILSLGTEVESWKNQRSGNFILRNGEFLFADTHLLNPEELCQKIGEKNNPDSINAALLVAKQRVEHPNSHQEFIDLLTKMNVFTEKDVRAFVLEKIIVNWEIFSNYPVQSQWQQIDNFDLFSRDGERGFEWSQIKQQIERRQQKWQKFMPAINNMDAVPYVFQSELEAIKEPKVKEHLSYLVDGKRNLLDIADNMGRDPYKIAKTYHSWFNSGWVHFRTAVDENNKLPIVLSVDDSPIVQTLIKRTLQDFCEVMLTDSTTEALQILDRHSVKLLLLDLTMPKTDGLEFCHAIRKMSKFKDLPIVMVTARDGLVNRAKGRFAGTNKYITKPFKPQELREVVRQFIAQNKISV